MMIERKSIILPGMEDQVNRIRRKACVNSHVLLM